MSTETPAMQLEPTVRSVGFAVTGAPDVANRYGSGTISPTKLYFSYRTKPNRLGRIAVHVHGHWRREDGTLTDQPIGQNHWEPMEDWPDWLAALARQHDTAALETTEEARS